MIEPIILFDANALSWQAFRGMPQLASRGVATGMLCGFLLQFPHMCELFETGKFVFVWDSRESHRRDKYPWYKAKRRVFKTEQEEEDRLDAMLQMRNLRMDILPRLGFVHNMRRKGFEGDDLIASIVKNNKGRFIVYSDDADLYQLLDDCDLWLPKKKALFTKADLKKEFGVTPGQWRSYKAINGCQTDSVPGVPKFGPKRTLAYLKGEELDIPKLEADLYEEQNKEIIKRNRWLTGLPLENTPDIFLDFSQEELDGFAMMEICRECGIASILNQKHIKILDHYLFTDRPIKGSSGRIRGLKIGKRF